MALDNFCVYRYNREDGTPYYFGIGNPRRPYVNHRHKGKGVHTPKDKSRIQIVKENLRQEVAGAIEVMWIAFYGKQRDNTGILLNVCDGGNISFNKGGTPWNKGMEGQYTTSKKGYKCSPEQIQKIKDNHPRLSGEKNGFFGKTHTEEYKQRRSALYKDKTYEEIMGKEKADRKKKKQSITQTQRQSSPEYKKAHSERMTQWWADKKRKQQC